MRPEILNPLFAEVEVLKGVGPQIAKLLKKLGITRLADILYHLPSGTIERVAAPHATAAYRRLDRVSDRAGWTPPADRV